MCSVFEISQKLKRHNFLIQKVKVFIFYPPCIIQTAQQFSTRQSHSAINASRQRQIKGFTTHLSFRREVHGDRSTRSARWYATCASPEAAGVHSQQAMSVCVSVAVLPLRTDVPE
jgi:hypothetical protein